MMNVVFDTVNDMRGGRQSWRVILMMSVPSFLVALLVATHI